MPLFEIVLRFPDREETRLTDTPPRDDTLEIAGRTWRVIERDVVRVVCEELRRDARELREDSKALGARSRQLRKRSDEIIPPDIAPPA